MIPAEREFSLATARQRIEADLAAHGLQWQATPHGSSLHATIVELFDADGRSLCTGVGKGDSETALTGGLFEAFEHYLTLHDACSVQHVITSTARIPKGLGAAIDALIATQPAASMACRTYADFLDGSTAIYPLALSRPTYICAPASGDNFDYTGLRRYASNNGTAIGSTYAEAALHAMNEAIERDDVSRFLRVHFHDRDDEELLLVDRRLADRSLSQIWLSAEDELGQSIVVLDISSHRFTHTYLAFAATCRLPIHVYGTGSSALASHAVARALGELVQVHTMARVVPTVREDLAKAECRLRPWPRLHRSCVADLPTLLTTGRCRRTIPLATPRSGPVRELLLRGMRGLREEGYRPLVHTIGHRGVSTAVCQVLVPGFDHYHLVGHGSLVVPFSRKRRARHAS